MRVIQRLMGVENPITDLKVYEHTLHFRNGVAVVESLTEREINRLRAFGFRVERDATRKKATQSAGAPATPAAVEPADVAKTSESLASSEASPDAPPAPAKAKRSAPKKEA